MSTKRKFSLIGTFLLSVIVVYISYSLLVDYHYGVKAEAIVEDYNDMYGSLKKKVKESVTMEETCIDEEKSLCKINIKLKKLDEINDVDFYYNQQVPEHFIAVRDGKVLYPEKLKGDNYDISYGKINENGTEFETEGSNVENINRLLLESVYNVYATEKVGKEYKSIEDELDEIENKREYLYFRFLF